jgi:hypothetical protein
MGTAVAPHVRGRTFSEARVLVPMVVLSLVWQLGAHADAWYHAHYGTAIDSFFTWSHAVLYAGWAGTALLALARLGRRQPLGRLRHSYQLVIAGVVIFGAGGALDFGWHRLFGFEAGLGTLFSPSHLWLLVGVIVANLGIFLATLWTAFYAAPLAVDYASGGVAAHDLPSFAGVDWLNQAAQTAGTTGILLHSVVLALFLTTAVRHVHVPTGGIFVLLLWDGLLTAATTGMWVYLPAVALGAAVGESWLAYARHRQPGVTLPEFAYWVLAGSVPVAQFTAYFGIMAVFGGGIAWTASRSPSSSPRRGCPC